MADEGYSFDGRISDGGTIADVNAGITTITMNDGCSITAKFVSPCDC